MPQAGSSAPSVSATGLAVEISGSQHAVSDQGAITGLTRAVSKSNTAQFVRDQGYPDGASAVDITHGKRVPIQTFKIDVAAGCMRWWVRRTSADDSGDRTFSELVWSQLRTYQPDAADYSGRKRVALKIKARVSSTARWTSSTRSPAPNWRGMAPLRRRTANPAWWVLAQRARQAGRPADVGGVQAC